MVFDVYGAFVANWGFLDGHAETVRLRDMMPDGAVNVGKRNRFDPAEAR